MNPEVRAAIIGQFTTSAVLFSRNILITVIKQGFPLVETSRTIDWMIDAEELTTVDCYTIRLTLKGGLAAASLSYRIKHYIAHNWLVLISLLLSVIGTISGVAGVIIALTALSKH